MKNEVNSRYMTDLQSELERYCTDMRGPAMPELNLSGLYDLYPSSDDTPCEYHWPDDWPSVDRPGVYFVFNAEMQVLYIGKASMNSWFGARLSSYFKVGANKECVIKNLASWKGKPRFVAVISMEDEFKFEAPGLEEYLITKLQPIDNRVGTAS